MEYSIEYFIGDELVYLYALVAESTTSSSGVKDNDALLDEIEGI